MALTPTRALLLTPEDDVAAVLGETLVNDEVAVALSTSGELRIQLKTRSAVPFGHKIAIRPIANGGKIIRYGYPIGVATMDIAEGEHVHSHNMRSLLSIPKKDENDERVLCSASWMRDLITRCLKAVDANADVAEAMADALTEAHLRGVETHGLRRLRPYISRIKSGGVDARVFPDVTRSQSVLHIDGRNGVGHFVAMQAAKAVSEAAGQSGIAVALVKNSNHFGFAGYYATIIAQAGQIGIVTSNGQVCVAPEGGTKSLLSNNPLAIAAPTGQPHTFVELDLATSVTSRANVVEAAKRGTRIPLGWAQDHDGKATRNPRAALEGSLLSLAGNRGFALLFALEAITGVLSGGAYGDQVSSKEASPNAPERTAHTLIAIDLKSALGVEAYTSRLDDLIARLLALPTNVDAPRVRYPGQRRWLLRERRLRDGIPLAAADSKDIIALARELGVPVTKMER